MLEAPRKEQLPAHGREVCPWTACPVHAAPTFADQAARTWQKGADARRLARKTLQRQPAPKKACFHCGGDRPEGLQLKKAGKTRRVCRPCYDNRHLLFGVGFPRAMRHLAPAVPA